MPRGASPKRELEYRELDRRFKKEGRYKGREDEVAARIVNKQRAQYGETKAEKKKDERGKSPDRDLPIQGYQHKTIPQISKQLSHLSGKEMEEIKRYEERHKKRKGVVKELERRLAEKS